MSLERAGLLAAVILIVGLTMAWLLHRKLRFGNLGPQANLQVRIPNETMLKSNVTTLTKFPIRRLDIKIGVAYQEDLDRVREMLLALADRNPVRLIEPAPLFIFLGFGDSALNFQFSVWATKENYLELLNSMHLEVKKAFDEAGVEIPFPHRTLYPAAWPSRSRSRWSRRRPRDSPTVPRPPATAPPSRSRPR